MPTHHLKPKAGRPEKEEEKNICFFAQTNYRNQMRTFGMKLDDRRRHTYVIGKTGMGKTTLMENMVLHDIYNGNGVGIVDPHGDFSEKIIDYIPAHRINDVVYFNPSDVEFPVGFNILEVTDPAQKHLIAQGLMATFKKIWPDAWSSRMEYILNNTLLALLDYPGATLLGINRLLGDKKYRKKVVAKLTDPVVKSFWQQEFAGYSEKYATEAVAPIQNKIGQFLSASVIRNMVAQVKSTIDIRQAMDSKKILIMNLSKGRIGEDNSRLLGGMLITKIQLAAMERVDTPEEDRKDFFLYVDEFQNFATPSFANILSEARKYRLGLIMAHQYVAQLDEVVADAVFGNVGTLITFRVGAADAEFLSKEFSPTFTEEDIINLPKFQIFLKLMIDGVSSAPFSAGSLPPIGQVTGSREKVVRVSRERYARTRDEIEDKITRWSSGDGDAVMVQQKVPSTSNSNTQKLDSSNNSKKTIEGKLVDEKNSQNKQQKQDKQDKNKDTRQDNKQNNNNNNSSGFSLSDLTSRETVIKKEDNKSKKKDKNRDKKQEDSSQKNQDTRQNNKQEKKSERVVNNLVSFANLKPKDRDDEQRHKEDVKKLQDALAKNQKQTDKQTIENTRLKHDIIGASEQLKKLQKEKEALLRKTEENNKQDNKQEFKFKSEDKRVKGLENLRDQDRQQLSQVSQIAVSDKDLDEAKSREKKEEKEKEEVEQGTWTSQEDNKEDNKQKDNSYHDRDDNLQEEQEAERIRARKLKHEQEEKKREQERNRELEKQRKKDRERQEKERREQERKEKEDKKRLDKEIIENTKLKHEIIETEEKLARLRKENKRKEDLIRNINSFGTGKEEKQTQVIHNITNITLGDLVSHDNSSQKNNRIIKEEEKREEIEPEQEIEIVLTKEDKLPDACPERIWEGEQIKVEKDIHLAEDEVTEVQEKIEKQQEPEKKKRKRRRRGRRGGRGRKTTKNLEEQKSDVIKEETRQHTHKQVISPDQVITFDN